MFRYKTGAAGAPSSAKAMAEYLTEATIPAADAKMAAYYAQDRGQEEGLATGMGTVPMPRRDLDPELAKALGIEPDKALAVEQFANVLTGHRADGTAWPGQVRPLHYRAATNEEGIETDPVRVGISYTDMVFSAPKSVSVAWALAPEVERQSIAQAHRDARDKALAYVEEQVAKAGFGHGGRQGGTEAGRMAWIICDHYTARPTLAITRPDPVTGVVDTELHTVRDNRMPGDMQLHSHCIVPNLMRTESGRFLAMNRDMLKGRVHEFGAVYQAFLAQGLRERGFEARLDRRTGMAFMPAVRSDVCDWFSKRHQQAEALAREMAAKAGQVWDRMKADEKIQSLLTGSMLSRQPSAGVVDAEVWRAQADALGYAPATFLSSGPGPQPASADLRLAAARDVALPYVAEDLVKNAVLGGGDVRAAAARGLIEHGIGAAADVGAVTRIMARDGVLQDGDRTRLVWRVDERDRVKITTHLHRDREQEVVALAKAAAADKRLSLTPAKVEAAAKRTGLDFTGEHGQAQRAAVETMGTQGGLAVMIGAAGVGKTKALIPPLVEAWRAEGLNVWGTALAYKAAKELEQGGIEADQCRRALDPFLSAVRRGDIQIDRKSVIVLDELGQVGTRQLLELLRLRAETGAKLVAVGDDKQCQAIEAGPVIELLRRALGEDVIPEIISTVRQQTEDEQRIVGLFRNGQAQAAVAAKRERGHAELAAGGYAEAVRRAANLHAELRIAHPGKSVSVSAPTNQDAREISRHIRHARRDMGEVGPDLAVVRASDGRGDDYEMPVAVGDRLRLYQQTRGSYVDGTGRTRSVVVGDNGSVLTVAAVLKDQGFRLQTEGGETYFVSLGALKPKGSDFLGITYGDSGTIDSSQGMTSDYHIHAFPSGSSAVDSFKNYVAVTRARHQSFMVGSMGAELAGAAAARPMGLPEPAGQDAHDAAWANVVRNLSRVPLKESALAMLEAGSAARGRSAAVLQEGLRKRQERKPRREIAPRLVQAGAKAEAARAERAAVQQARRSMRPAAQRPKEKVEPVPKRATELTKAMGVFADLVAKKLLKIEEAREAVISGELARPLPAPEKAGLQHVANVYARLVTRGVMREDEAVLSLSESLLRGASRYDARWANEKADRMLDLGFAEWAKTEAALCKALDDAVTKAGKALPPSQAIRDAARQKASRTAVDGPGADAAMAAREVSRRAQASRGSGQAHGL